KSHRRVDSANPFRFKSSHQVAGNLIHALTRVMEFEIGHGSCRVMNRLAVHSHDKADQRFGLRKEAQDVISFRCKLRAIDLNKTDVVSAGFKNGLAQLLRVKYDGHGAYRASRPFVKSFDAWMLGFFWHCWISSLLTFSGRLSCRPLPPEPGPSTLA